MNNEEVYPVVVIQGHPCMGCGMTGRACLELGVRGGYQTLACRECTNMIFDRTDAAIEDNQVGSNTSKLSEVGSGTFENINDTFNEESTIKVEVDLNE